MLDVHYLSISILLQLIVHLVQKFLWKWSWSVMTPDSRFPKSHFLVYMLQLFVKCFSAHQTIPILAKNNDDKLTFSFDFLWFTFVITCKARFTCIYVTRITISVCSDYCGGISFCNVFWFIESTACAAACACLFSFCCPRALPVVLELVCAFCSRGSTILCSCIACSSHWRMRFSLSAIAACVPMCCG